MMEKSRMYVFRYAITLRASFPVLTGHRAAPYCLRACYEHSDVWYGVQYCVVQTVAAASELATRCPVLSCGIILPKRAAAYGLATRCPVLSCGKMVQKRAAARGAGAVVRLSLRVQRPFHHRYYRPATQHSTLDRLRRQIKYKNPRFPFKLYHDGGLFVFDFAVQSTVYASTDIRAWATSLCVLQY